MVVKSLGDRPSVVENCGITNAESEDRVDLLFGIAIATIRAERPGVGVQSKDIMPPAHFLFCNSQSFRRFVSATQVIQNELPVCIDRFVRRIESPELKVLVSAGGR